MFKGLGRMLGLSRPSARDNPALAGLSYLNQIPQVAGQYLNPYLQSGQTNQQANPDYISNLYAPLENEYAQGNDIYQNQFPPQYGQMANDPLAFLNKMQRGYTPSEGYKYKEKKMLDAMRNSAASGGFLGTRGDQIAQAEGVQGMLGSDMQQFLDNLFRTQGGGLGGLERMLAGRERTREGRGGAMREKILSRLGAEEGAANRGYEAATGLAGLNASNLSQQGTYGYMGRLQRNQDRAIRDRNIRNMLTNIAGNIAMPGSGSFMGGGAGGGGGHSLGGGSLPSGGFGF